jgi:hypothetical protein
MGHEHQDLARGPGLDLLRLGLFLGFERAGERAGRGRKGARAIEIVQEGLVLGLGGVGDDSEGRARDETQGCEPERREVGAPTE